ncbi:DUF3570 domain-containing protein [Undibacterium sp. LX15W]|uniref:DUF3570 domain-containing protein n=2 Tax=Undibacterium flavidum TaxID=2762297 RepID=A0ABR6YE68_9BURK|nr:DUF3570 domain-containing protein [Undibacterium flavidum]
MPHTSSTPPHDTVATALLTAALSLFACDVALADEPPERGVIALKYLDYFDYQTSADRIRVKATALKLISPIAGEWALGSSVVTDGISGASPVYHSAGLKKMRDRRNAADVDLTRYFENSSVSVAANYSHEADYESRGLSLQTTYSSADRNTVFSAALGASNDEINPVNHIVRQEKKMLRDVLFSVSQVLSTDDIVQFNVGFSHGTGYFSDPYKVFDQRPRERNNHTLTVRWNHHLESLSGSMRLSYRYYADNWNIKAHTLSAEYGQPLTQGWTITPMLRLYSQTAAEFYVDAGPEDYPFPPNPPAKARYFSEDHRVSAFGAFTYGVKVSKQINQDWAVDVKLEQYKQAASLKWFGAGSAGLQSFYARSLQVGVSRQF